MPLIISVRGYRVLFYSHEGHPREPLHVHVRRAECQAKVWVEPSVSVASCFGFNSTELREIIEIVETNIDLIRRRWDEHFGS